MDQRSAGQGAAFPLGGGRMTGRGKTKDPLLSDESRRSWMAEKPGFEPGLRLTHTTPLAGEPLRPLGYFSMSSKYEIGGERGIRTPGVLRHHWFSRPAPSTARPSLHCVNQRKRLYHRLSVPSRAFFLFFGYRRRERAGIGHRRQGTANLNTLFILSLLFHGMIRRNPGKGWTP